MARLPRLSVLLPLGALAGMLAASGVRPWFRSSLPGGSPAEPPAQEPEFAVGPPCSASPAPVRLPAVPAALAAPTAVDKVEGSERVLAGRLVDVEGRPVPSASLWVWPDPQRDADGKPRGSIVQTTSDREGAFRAEGVAAGPLGMTVKGWPAGRHTHVRKIGVPAGDVEVVIGSPREIAGRVVDADTGAPVPRFEIVGYKGFRLCGNAPPELRQEFNDPVGSFRLSGLASDTNFLEFRVPGYAQENMTTGGIRTSEARALVVRMPRAVTVRGRVLDRVTGAPMVGQAVHLAFPGGGRSLSRLGTTREDGSFELSGIRPGSFRLCAGNDFGFESTSEPFEALPGAVVDGVVILHGRGGTIEGVARCEAAPDMRSVLVWLRREAERNYRTNVSPDSDGRFRFHGLFPGEYVVELAVARPSPPGGNPEVLYTEARARVAEGETTTVLFREAPAARGK